MKIVPLLLPNHTIPLLHRNVKCLSYNFEFYLVIITKTSEIIDIPKYWNVQICNDQQRIYK